MGLKKLFYITFFVVAFVLSSCTNDDSIIAEEDSMYESNNVSSFIYTMQFDAPYPHYNGDGNTRATSSGEWEDGDVIYLFLGGKNEAYANATYDKEHNNWKLYSDRMLEACNTAECSVWYGKGGGCRIITETAEKYDYLTEAYICTSGKYSYISGAVKVSADLKPYARRIRFKGTPGTSFKLQGKGTLIPYNKISITGSTGFELSGTKNWDLKVNDDGYTDYHVFLADASTVKLTIIDPQTLYTYSRYFDKKTLKEGESGCLTVPTSNNHSGWSYGHEWQYEFVDLGLPSGTLWATCNVGAFSPEEYGYYFAWGETEPKDTYKWDNYKWGKDANRITKYCTRSSNGIVDGKTVLDPEDDAARINWGGAWRMPTRDELTELCGKCFWTWSTLLGVKGYKVVGPNGNTIFLPAAGSRYHSSLSYADSFGYCWSCSLDTSNSNLACYLYFTSGGQNTDNSYRFNGQSVHPVCQMSRVRSIQAEL